MSTTLPERHEVPSAYTWDIESLFATPADWDVAFAGFTAQFEELAAFRGQLGQDSVLFDCLEYFWQTNVKLKQLGIYAGLCRSVNAHDQLANARYSRYLGLMSQFQSATAFISPEILALGQETILAMQETHQGLRQYAQALAQLEVLRPHTRSSEVEVVLGQSLDPLRSANSLHGTLVNSDLRFGEALDSQGRGFEVAQGTIANLLKSHDRVLRQNAYQSYADAHLAFENTMANALVTGIKTDVFIAKARGYSNSLEASLKPTMIPLGVFHTLIDTFKAHLPLWHRYWRARAAILGLEQLELHDVACSLAPASPTVPYQQAVDWICQGMAPLGPDYVNAMRIGLTSGRWVDIYPNKGKRQGAFSSGTKGTKSYIFMSYHDDLYSLSTLAHEIGHSMHSQLTGQNQPPVYANYTLFVAEVASNFNQALVRDHLFRQASDKDLRLAIIDEAMANFLRYFFIMPTLARFELEVHERVERGQALGANALNDLMADLFSEGYGQAVKMDQRRVGITWAQFSTHLYSNFYVYQYATGIAGAHALAKQVLDGVPEAASRYLEFLSAGSSLPPLEVLKRAGVDLTTSAPVEAAFAVLEGYIAELEALAAG
jgi:oligoendopeptidase F